MLCFVFDKIHFPGAYLPKGDYDKELLQHEIDRLESIEPLDYNTRKLIGILKFLDYRLPLDGIIEYPSTKENIAYGRNDSLSGLAQEIYDVHYPPRENFEPLFDASNLKGLPESFEDVVYRGDFYYQAGAITYAAQRQIPLLDDGSWLPLPFKAQYKDNAQSLATLIAFESTELILPDLPVLSTQELIEFRMENTNELRTFRSAMLRYAAILNREILDGTPTEEIMHKAKFFVQTEIAPALHDLERDLQNPNRPWYKRFTDAVRVSSSTLIGILTGGLFGQTAASGIRELILSEIETRGSKKELISRIGLYYLIRAKYINGL